MKGIRIGSRNLVPAIYKASRDEVANPLISTNEDSYLSDAVLYTFNPAAKGNLTKYIDPNGKPIGQLLGNWKYYEDFDQHKFRTPVAYCKELERLSGMSVVPYADGVVVTNPGRSGRGYVSDVIRRHTKEYSDWKDGEVYGVMFLDDHIRQDNRYKTGGDGNTIIIERGQIPAGMSIYKHDETKRYIGMEEALDRARREQDDLSWQRTREDMYREDQRVNPKQRKFLVEPPRREYEVTGVDKVIGRIPKNEMSDEDRERIRHLEKDNTVWNYGGWHIKRIYNKKPGCKMVECDNCGKKVCEDELVYYQSVQDANVNGGPVWCCKACSARLGTRRGRR